MAGLLLSPFVGDDKRMPWMQHMSTLLPLHSALLIPILLFTTLTLDPIPLRALPLLPLQKICILPRRRKQ
jgi:hypothetical protein